MTDPELTELLTKSRSYGDLIPGLIEYVFRQYREIKALKNQLECQHTKPAKKSDRAKKDFYVDGILLTDEYIAHYAEGNYFTITELERLVEAKKNRIRKQARRIMKTFIDHYCYSRYSDEQKKAELEKILNL